MSRDIRMSELSREMAASSSFWEYGPNGERWFPIDPDHFGKPLKPNADGTYDMAHTGYVYRPILANGRRIRNDPTDHVTIVLWDPRPLNNGAYLAMTAGLAVYEVGYEDIKERTYRPWGRAKHKKDRHDSP